MRPLGLAIAAGLPVAMVWAIETGLRRPTHRTLRHTAEALAAWSPSLGSPDDVLVELVGLAGPHLAPDPMRTLRAARRRMRRAAHRRRVHAWLDEHGRRG